MNSTEEIIADLKAGKMVIIMDDEDRENEGDLVMLAEKVRPEDVNFMARYGRGLICLTLTRERCRQLRLPLMVNDNGAAHATKFTVSIEAAEGVTTGISAHDRARTIQAAVAPEARPEDVVQPGHIFPLMAEPGGVLNRAGHTEAGCDLARLAGAKESAAVIVEILNEDGTMARRPDLEVFAREHDIKLGTIADLIRYRLANEHTVERVVQSKVETEFGPFELMMYEDRVDKTVHMALVRGPISPEEPTLVRVHLRNTLADVVGVSHSEFGWPVRDALHTIAEAGRGVLVVLRKWETPHALVQTVSNLQRSGGRTTMDADESPNDEPEQDLRTYGIGAQILADIGVRKMRVLSAPKRMHAVSGFGLEVTEYVQHAPENPNDEH
nr:3,4-dihydroxy-2-butanone-4-phosphate synthase [Oceanococcus sp. HetDA_MAG_MS8]